MKRDERRDERRTPKQAKPVPPRDKNRALTAQNRKLLGKHYSNKYRTGRKA